MLEAVRVDIVDEVIDGRGRALVAVRLDDPPMILCGVKVVFDPDVARCSVEAPECVVFNTVWDRTLFAVYTFRALERFGLKHRIFDQPTAPQGATVLQ